MDSDQLVVMPFNWAILQAPYLRYELLYRVKEMIKDYENDSIITSTVSNNLSFFLDDMNVYDLNYLVGAVFFDEVELGVFERLKYVLTELGQDMSLLSYESNVSQLDTLLRQMFELMIQRGEPEILS